MGGTYIEKYEKDFVEKAARKAAIKTKKEIALKMKAAGIDSKIILECTGVYL